MIDATLASHIVHSVAQRFYEHGASKTGTMPPGAPVYWSELPSAIRRTLVAQWDNFFAPIWPVVEETLEDAKREAEEHAHVLEFRVAQFVHDLEGRGEDQIAAELSQIMREALD